MKKGYEQYTVRQLREMVWNKGLLSKRWMLNYVRKKEAINLLTKFSKGEDVPEAYVKVIKERSSKHRKKVYKSRKDRQALFGAPLSRDERLQVATKSASRLVFKERREYDVKFTSYLGSTRAKVAFVFNDPEGTEFLFTKSEVKKLSSMGLYVPRGILSSEATPKAGEPSRRRLKDLFGEV